MTYWHLSDREVRRHALTARRLQGEAITRAAYLAVVALERAADFALRSLGRGLEGLVRRLKQDRVRRLAIADLQRLDDRMLRDIGLGRSEISAVVDESLTGAPRSIAEIRHLPRPSRPRTGGGHFREAA